MRESPGLDFGPNGERRIRNARGDKLPEDERLARARLSRQRWTEANPNYAREWKQANADKHRAHSRGTAQRKRRRERRNKNARAKYRENPEPHRERGRRFRQEHPEKVAEYKRRYREKNPERAAEQSRRAAEKWRDTNAASARAKGRTAAVARREANPNQFRDWYTANIERERERSREGSRLRSRLKALGLPPRQITKVYAADKRANTAAADKFFGQGRTKHERDDFLRHQQPTRAGSGFLRSQAKELYEPTPSHLLAAWVRDSAIARSRLSIEQRREMFASYLTKHGARLRDEIAMDSRARVLRGAAPLDVERELKARTAAALNEAESARLTRIVNRAMTSFGVPPSGAVTGAQPKTSPGTTTPSSTQRSNHER